METRGGTWGPDARFVSAGIHPSATFLESKVVLQTPLGSASLTFGGANPREPKGKGLLEGRTNEYRGTNPENWAAGLRTYGQVVYRGLYDGIDIAFSSSEGSLKYEIHAAAGADIGKVALSFEGAVDARLESSSSFALDIAGSAVVDRLGPSWDGHGREVACTFELRGPATVGFACPAWDPTTSLTIDPFLYASYIGGLGQDDVGAVSLDASGSYYIAGRTSWTDFPTTPGAYDTTFNGWDDFYIMKFDANNTLLFSTYVGGTQGEYVADMAIGPDGGPYVIGYSYSSDFPTSPGAFDNFTNASMEEPFVIHLSASGALVYSTYLGGWAQDWADAITVDAAGAAYIVGTTQSSDFPTTVGAYDETYNSPNQADGFLTKLSPDGTSVAFSTFIGGNDHDRASGVSVEANGTAIVVGMARSTDYPTTVGAYDRALGGPNDVDAFVTAVSPDGSSLVFSTLIGGAPQEVAFEVALRPSGSILLVGQSNGAGSPTTAGAFDTTHNGGNQDVGIWELSGDGSSLLYGGYFGGNGEDYAADLALGADGDFYFGGNTGSTDLPTTPYALSSTRAAFGDSFFVKMNASGDRLEYSTYFGSTAASFLYTVEVLSPQVVLLGGNTGLDTFAATPDAFDSNLTGYNDGFLARLDMRTVNVTIETAPAGLPISVGGVAHTGPFSFSCAAWTPFALNLTPLVTNGSVRYLFANWSDGGAQGHIITCDADKVVTANFSFEYAVRLLTDPSSLSVLADGVAVAAGVLKWWGEGTTRAVDAPSPQGSLLGDPLERWVFDSWSDGGAKNHAVSVSGPLNLTARFSREFLVNVSSNPPNLPLTVDGVEVSASAPYWWAENSSHRVDALAVAGAGPTSRLEFVSWTDAGARNHSFNVTGPLTLVATYLAWHLVRLETDPPGLEISVGAQWVTGPYEQWYPAGSTVAVDTNSTHNRGTTRHLFSQWSDGGSESHSIVVVGPIVLRASFVTDFFIDVRTFPVSLPLAIDGTVRQAPYSAWWAQGTNHTVAVPPSSGLTTVSRWIFVGWNDGGAQDRTVTALAAQVLNASFRQEFKLSLETLRGATACDRPGCWYPAGESANFSVPTPVDGPAGVRYSFSAWDGDASSGSNNGTVAMDGPKTLVAHWKTEYLLTVNAGYGATTGGGWYAAGASASLSINANTVTVNGTRFEFAGWTGAVVSADSAVAVTMDGPKVVEAQWRPAPSSETGIPIGLVGIAAALGVGGLAAVLLVRRRRRPAQESLQPRTSPVVEGAKREEGDPSPGPVAAVPSSSGERQAPAAGGLACPQCSAPIEAFAPACSACGLALTWS